MDRLIEVLIAAGLIMALVAFTAIAVTPSAPCKPAKATYLSEVHVPAEGKTYVITITEKVTK